LQRDDSGEVAAQLVGASGISGFSDQADVQQGGV
jgi:hypothetical protein